MVSYQFRIAPKLKRLLIQAARKESRAHGQRITMNDVASKILAAYFGQPELGKMNRKTPGRKPLA